MGFFIDNQLAKAIKKLEKKIFAIKKITEKPKIYPKKFFIFDIGLLSGS